MSLSPGNPSPPADPARFEEALRQFDQLNAADPNKEQADSHLYPRELLYAQRLTEWVLKLCPNPSEPLRLAARCQHLCRWMIPRNQYEPSRTGYLRWRSDLQKFHARKSAEVLRQVGYPDSIVERVQQLNLKKKLASDPEVQVLEDALCLVFLQYQFAELARKTSEEKMISALRKSWNKMSPQGRSQAKELQLPSHEADLLQKALEEPS